MAGELGSFNSAGMLAIVGFLAGSYLIGRIGGLLLAHLPNESTRTDTAFSIVRQILYAGILVGPILISGTYWIDTSLPVVSQTVVGKILTGALFLTILTGIGAWLVNQSLQPAAKKHYGPKPSLDSTIRWYGRLVPAGAFFVFAMYLHVLMNNPTSYHLAGLLFLTVFLWPAVKFATMPVPSQHFTRPATDTEREHIENCSHYADQPPSRVVIDERQSKYFPVIYRRRGPFETLDIKASILESASERELSFALAHATARKQKRMDDHWQLNHDATIFAFHTVWFGIFNILLLVNNRKFIHDYYSSGSIEATLYAATSLLLAAGIMASVLLMRRQLHRRTNEIDDWLVRQFGVDVVREIYAEKSALITSLSDEYSFTASKGSMRRQLNQYANPEPLLSERIDRLEGRSESDVDGDCLATHR